MNSYFKEKYLSDRDKISKLLEIDDNYTYESFYELMNKDIDINIDSYDTVLLENSSVLLLNLIDKDIDIIVCTLDNYGLNNYIIEKNL